MKFRWLSVLGFFVLLPAVIPADAQSYADELQQGVDAYKHNHYEQAIAHFRKATELDPSKPVAHLYLATSCVSQYIPGVDEPDNLRFAEQAIEQYHAVLDSNAEIGQKDSSAKGIAYLYLNTKKWDDAKTYYQKASSFDPNDPEPYYSIGVIDWTRCYQPRMEARAQLGMRPDEHLNVRNPDQKRVCYDLRAKNLSTIEEGIETLNKAIQLRPDYDDAMAYMNLMYREKADLECDDLGLQQEDLKTADHWVDVTLRAKKQKAERSKAPQESTAPNPQ